MTAMKKVLVAAGGVAAIASSGVATFILIRRAPKRQEFRESTGWTSAYASASRAQSASKRMPNSPPNPASAAAAPKPAARPIDSSQPAPAPGFFGGVKEVFSEFSADDVMTQAAALAFYTGLSLAPLLTIVAWAARVFLPQNNKYDVAKVFSQVMGKQAYEPINSILEPATQQASKGMTIAGMVSIGLVALSASGVFGQVQSALNTIWHVQAKPSNGLVGFIQKRVLSLGMLLSILFLLLVSLVVSTMLQGRLKVEGESANTILAIVINNVGTVGVFTVLFALMFKFVPDAKINWKSVWVGGAVAALLFAAGKLGLSIYLGKGDYETSYGAVVGSFVALLVWVYYSAIILLIGAEATKVYARRQGNALQPDKHAVRVIQTTEPA